MATDGLTPSIMMSPAAMIWFSMYSLNETIKAFEFEFSIEYMYVEHGSLSFKK